MSIILKCLSLHRQIKLCFMKELEKRIFVSDLIFDNELSYVSGDNKSKLVRFSYYQVKTGKEIPVRLDFNYINALNFARCRSNDKRYKNYEFLIF